MINKSTAFNRPGWTPRQIHHWKGFTLFQCLTLMVLLTIFGAVNCRLLITEKRLIQTTVWGRTAEALADGALEAGLAQLEIDNATPHLEIQLDTGLAIADISPGAATSEHIIRYSGINSTENGIRAERHYEAVVVKTESGQWVIKEIKRKTASQPILYKP